METLQLAGTLLGGLGIFLVAISMMTDGLKLAAGSSLRRVLGVWTKTPQRGIASGFCMTALVQSSSAVTVASLGFVNAGLITMHQALGIVYGANVGTTITGWLVAAVGFKFNIQAIALPLIGIGALMKLLLPRSRLASAGMALVGFGLFFIGIDILKGAFEHIVAAFDLSQFTAKGISGMLTFLLVGMVMTTLTQSSSASIALTITAAASGMIGLYAAGAMVIGANVGTTSTSILASIGATSNAKRVAAAQVIFNVFTAMVAFAVLPVLFYLIKHFTALFGVTADPALSLALFHTLFNILGVLLIFPLNDRLAGFLMKRFCSAEETASRPRFLDNTIAQTPELAINALLLESKLVADKVLAQFDKCLLPTDKLAVEQALHAVQSLCQQISLFIVSVEQSALSPQTTSLLAKLMRIEQYLFTCSHCVEQLVEHSPYKQLAEHHDLHAQLNEYQAQLSHFMKTSLHEQSVTPAELSLAQETLQRLHDDVKDDLILAGTHASLAIDKMVSNINTLTEMWQLSQQWHKAMLLIHAIEAQLSPSQADHL
ncbi:Na/Pi cotransporter family protein [Pseudoalteromonas piscicida]|uniref:Na/Pi cotransporter family protein n=1 Tax=Pseudoalteromonas piscicida TaxID=43662 RepID=A0AAD0RFA5_PSEO7|nr:Na/Pi symporter [Pseudoalteromonas piscicida]ASD67830.1 MFS transporter [Pseudoalteromonas piscicida]AXQ98755.1 Na/Pi cotransporter family protein [Pseudoalteromonas piscicida]AXR01467.1 Na/Pi cotransporter family protein [Pseudoalteromonas piscicida]